MSCNRCCGKQDVNFNRTKSEFNFLIAIKSPKQRLEVNVNVRFVVLATVSLLLFTLY